MTDAENPPQQEQDEDDSHAPPPDPLRDLDFTPFEAELDALTPERIAELDALVLESTVQSLHAAFADNTLTVTELVTYYLHRIREHDVDGLRAVLELNPDALTLALELDANPTQGALYGIPVLIKDNIATGDSMHTTAGAAALRDAQADRDAFLVARLRDAGAVILGKANLSEWAYWMFENGPSGYTALGGQVVNPYDPAVDPYGSSTGSAVGVAANLATLSVGTETAGSIIAPASRTSTVGIHPSIGLISRDYVIPLSDQLDTAGPITRTVTDATVMLTVMAGVDSNDPMTALTESIADQDFTAFLDANALQGKRIGIPVRELEVDFDTAMREAGLTEIVDVMRSAGAEVVMVNPQEINLEFEDFVTLLSFGMKNGTAAYLADTGFTEIQSIADVVAFNNSDPQSYAFYGQERLETAAINTNTREEVVAIAEQMRQTARDYIHALYATHNLDMLATVDNSFSFIYAVAGYPAISVPGGYRDTAPFGITFVGGEYLTDATVIAYAYAFEQATRSRRPPPMQ